MKILNLLLLFILFSQAEAKDVQLKWKAIEGAEKYNLEVASDDDFSKTVIKETVDQNSHGADLKTGTYYVRVQAINEYGLAGVWSSPFKLIVTTPVITKKPDATPESEASVKFSDRRPAKVKTKWEPPEPAEKYQVVVKKDGKEIQRFETKETEAQIFPQEEGQYQVEVSSSLEDHFGPPTMVKKFKLEKSQPEEKGKFVSRGHVNLALQPDPQAKYYEIAIYKEDDNSGDRTPQSIEGKKPFLKIKSKNPKAFLGKMPPGRYVASVTPVTASGDSEAPVTDYNFEVQKAKPVEFDHVDLSFRYSVRSASYYSYISEAGSSVETDCIGGDVGFEGQLWFPNSKWGVKAKGNFGNLLVNNKTLTNSELLLAGQYSVSKAFKVAAGPRIWQLPIMLNDNPNGQDNPLFYKNFSPTFVGPAINLDYTYVLNPKWALNGWTMLSAPVAHSNFTGSDTQKPVNFTPNIRLELGAKYALGGNIRLLASAGAEHHEFSHNTTQGRNGTFVAGSQTRVSMDSALLTFGAELTDDGAQFNNDRQVIKEKFSEIDLTARYSATPLSYSSHVLEISNVNQSQSFGADTKFNSPTSGELQLDTVGYFLQSHHGFKFSVNWGGYTYQGTTVSYPEFGAQWAYRNSAQKNSTWGWENYLGFRSWQVPLVVPMGGGNGSSSYLSENPQLLGIAEGFKVKYPLNSLWKLSLLAEISSPFLVSNQSANVSSLRYFFFSYKTNLDISYAFSKDINAGLGLGYKTDRFDYTPTNYNNTYSNIVITSPMISIFGVYGF